MGESISKATERSVQSARASGELGDKDAGAVAVLLELARQVEYLAANDGMREDGRLDNVSIPTYLKFCESLGLTPVSRTKLGDGKKEGAGGKLSVLQGEAQRRRKAG